MNDDAYAFFDVDETIIQTKSMFAFFEYWCREWLQDADLLAAFNAHFEKSRAACTTREETNRAYYRFLSGVDPDKLAAAGERWAQHVIDAGAFHTVTVSRLKELSKQGVVPVFVSGSFKEVLGPIAKHLKVKHILATKMLIGSDGAFSGEIGTPQTIGAGKALSVNQSWRSMAPIPRSAGRLGTIYRTFQCLNV